MTEGDFLELLRAGHESLGVEFKGPGSRTDKHFLARVARAALGMANRRDGGVVVIGVREGEPLDPVGLDGEIASTWANYNVVIKAINKFADPSLSLSIEKVSHRGKLFEALTIHEFDEVPILCKADRATQDKQVILRAGACYVRSRHKPGTSELPSQQEMRSLIELAVGKGVRRFVETAREAGLIPRVAAVVAPPTDADRFAEQLEGIP